MGYVSGTVFPASKMMTADRVNLAEATMLYQPVLGTAEGSRYFVIAASERFKIAARVKSNTRLALRIEGPGVLDMSEHPRLAAVGFDLAGSSHWSLHANIDDEIVLLRVVGGVLLAMREQWITRMPWDFGKIYGLGSGEDL